MKLEKQRKGLRRIGTAAVVTLAAAGTMGVALELVLGPAAVGGISVALWELASDFSEKHFE